MEVKGKSLALLASMSDQLSSIVQPDAEFNSETIYVRGAGGAVSGIAITYSELSKYLRASMGKYVPVLLETRLSSVDSNKVMVNREWLERQVSAAEKRVGLGGGELAQNYIDEPSGERFQELNRLDGDRLSEIDNKELARYASDRLALQDIQARLAEAESLIVELKAKERASADDSRSLYNELRAKDKKIQERDEQIELLKAELDKFTNCFNTESPVHPKGLYEAFQCWQAVTENGTRDPSGPGGRGAQSLVLDWLRSRGEPDVGSMKKPGLRVKRLAAVIGWRGKGSGAIRSK